MVIMENGEIQSTLLAKKNLRNIKLLMVVTTNHLSGNKQELNI